MLSEIIENPIFISVLLLLMFIVSGVNKVFSFEKTVDSLVEKMQIDIPIHFFNIIIVLVILFEIIAPVFVIYYFITGNYKTYAYYSVISLCIFTILATFIYHPPVLFYYKKSLGFWANMSLVGGLLLLAKYINQM
jgi:uncharacterized membrane protein YphA (DoxX/SURF4 family)